MGATQNKTEKTDVSAATTTSANTTVGVAKLNYTFALAYPAKLGVSGTFDLKNSKIANAETLATNGITEVSIELGIAFK
jgi:hypothetical protein